MSNAGSVKHLDFFHLNAQYFPFADLVLILLGLLWRKVSEERRQQRIEKDSKKEWSGEESGGLNRIEEWNDERRVKRTGVD